MACPRLCGVDRRVAQGYCGANALPNIARAALHSWEEPCISGTRGSGTVFFCGCNMRCVFCQNGDINHSLVGDSVDEHGLLAVMRGLQRAGAHNINFVTPTPHVQLLARTLKQAKREGFSLPIVYNTNGYERVEMLKTLGGLVDVYLPDIKYVTREVAARYSDTPEYFDYAQKALLEMHKQAGPLRLGEDGTAQSGLIVRHLVLPGAVAETRRVLDFLADTLPPDTHISLMAQYVPAGNPSPPLDRPLKRREYERAVEYCVAKGFHNVFVQALSSASSAYTPAFDGSVFPG